MAYKNKYKISFRELKTNVLWESYIMLRDYAGSISEIVGSGRPLIREYRPEHDNDWDWIRPSICTISFISPVVRQFLEFYTSDDRKYKIKIYRNSVFMWAGWLLPETYQENYADVNFEVSISATDGLLSLKDVPWQKVGGEPDYVGMKSLMRCIEGCLNKLNLPEVDIWDASYIYEKNMTQTDASSPLWQSYVNAFLFYDNEGQPQSCYDVLKTVLASQNCQIWMQEGCWNIVPQNARKVSYVRRKYGWAITPRAKGSYSAIGSTVVTTETKDPVLTLDNTNIGFYDGAGLSFRPGWKKLILKHDYGFNSNILYKRLPVFTQGFKGGITENGIVRNSNHYFDFADHGANQYMLWDLGAVEASNEQSLKISIKGNRYCGGGIKVYIVGASSTLYVDNDGHWHPNPEATVTILYPEWQPLVTDDIPIDGKLYVKIMAMSTSARVRDRADFKLTDFTIDVLTAQVFYEDIEVTTKINEDNFYVPEEITIPLADCPIDEPIAITTYYANGLTSIKMNPSGQDSTNARLIYMGILYYLSGGVYHLTSSWTVKGRNQYNRLVNVISDEIAVNHIDPQWIYTGDMYGLLEYGSILNIDGKKYMMLRATQNAYDREWNVELFEVADTDQGYIRLRAGGYIKTRTGGKIKVQ